MMPHHHIISDSAGSQGFHRRPHTAWLHDGRRMILSQDFHYTSKGGVTYTAPRGTIIDGKTTPRLLWAGWLAGSPYTGPARYASIIHDYQCGQARREPIAVIRRSMRRAADHLFREMVAWSMDEPLPAGHRIRNAIRRTGRRAKAGAMFLGVRIGGLFGEIKRLFA